MKVVLVCIARNEDNYIKEWTDYHFKLGFNKIIIYQDRWECLLDDEKIIKINMDDQEKGRQVHSYNHFMKNFSNDYDYVAFFDIDEFLVLKQHKNIKEFLEDYKECQSIGINWVYFGDNGLEEVANNEYDVIKRFTKRQKKVGSGVKNILKLDEVGKNALMSVHHPYCQWCSTEKTLHEGAGNENGTDDVAQLNHYYCKTKQEFLEKKIKHRADDNTIGLDQFLKYNFNEVEDLFAYNFFYGK